MRSYCWIGPKEEEKREKDDQDGESTMKEQTRKGADYVECVWFGWLDPTRLVF